MKYEEYEILKKNKNELSKNMIETLISDLMNGKINESEMIKFINLFADYGLNALETAYLTKAMANSGVTLDLQNLNKTGKKIIDDPSTGGILTKTPIIVSTILSCFNFIIPKLSSASLPKTRGTIDILKAIPNFKADIDFQVLKLNLEEVGICFIEPTKDICPADKKIYTLRKLIRDTQKNLGAMKAPSLLVSSILSKKLAMRCEYVIVDIKIGPGGNVDDKESAKNLAKLFIEVGKILNLTIGCVITNEIDQPQGRAYGMNLAMIEVINCLKGNISQDEDIYQIAINIAANALVLTNETNSIDNALKKVKKVIDNGDVYKKFKEIISQQGGSLDYVENIDHFILAESIHITSIKSGYVESIDVNIIDSLAKKIIIDSSNPDVIQKDYTCGIFLDKKVGEYVQSGESVATVFSKNLSSIKKIKQDILKAYKISNQKPSQIKIILCLT